MREFFFILGFTSMTTFLLISPQPSLTEFHDAFQVVFVDPSGHLNMCADMTACAYKQVCTVTTAVCAITMRLSQRDEATGFDLFSFNFGLQLQHEASVSMEFWDNPTVDGFHCLLMTPTPMMRTSDHVFQYVCLSTNGTKPKVAAWFSYPFSAFL